MIAIQNVSRYDHKRYHAWVVCIRRRGRVVTRYFADRVHGGRSKALQAAVAFRDQVLERLPPLSFVTLSTARSKTGIIGVRVQVDRRKQGTYRAYVASWPDPAGRGCTRSFSFAKFGKARAFELARKARRDGLAHLVRTAPKTRPLNRRRRKMPA